MAVKVLWVWSLSLNLNRLENVCISHSAALYGWRYTRYADDLTFSLPNGSKEKRTFLGQLQGCIKKVVADEGFVVHPDKTSVLRGGAGQRVTGMVINGAGSPRAKRSVRRNLRAAILNLKQGKPLKDGETVDTLRGMAAFIGMSDRELGAKFRDEIEQFAAQ